MTPGAPTLGVLVLARDEGPTLGRAIDSIREIASDVLVGVDTATTDDTAEVARSHGARVVPIAFRGDFAEAHNRLDASVDTELAFKLDGHEYLAPGHDRLLREAIASEEAATCGAIAIRLQMSAPEGGARCLVLRAYRRGPAVRYEGAVHEQVVGFGSRFVPRPDIVLHHDRPARRAAARLDQRVHVDLSRLRQRVVASPHDPVGWFHLAGLLEAAGELEEARAAGLRAWQQGGGAKDTLRGEIAVRLARLSLALGQREEALAHARDATRACWCVPEAWLVLAEAADDCALAEHARRIAHAIPYVPWEYPQSPLA